MIFTEKQLKAFSAPLSDTEDEKCKHAIQEVRDSLATLGFEKSSEGITRAYSNTSSYQTFMRNAESGENIKIFLQGSYANNTNVKAESDVDIAVIKEDNFYTLYRTEGNHPQNDSTFHFVTLPQETPTFKDRVEVCLKQSFPKKVTRHNKSIKVSGNSYRKDADTVPAKRYRNYKDNYSDDPKDYIGGIIIKPDDNGPAIVNYPEQHIKKGREKNISTNYSYKKQVRILKSIKNIMDDSGYSSSQKMSSFGLESLFWNVPNNMFQHYSILGFTFEDILTYLIDHKNDINSFKEANGIKNLCSNKNKAADYIAFISDLKSFYEFSIEE